MDRRFEGLRKYMVNRFEDMNCRFGDMFRLLQLMFVVFSLLIAVFVLFGFGGFKCLWCGFEIWLVCGLGKCAVRKGLENAVIFYDAC